MGNYNRCAGVSACVAGAGLLFLAAASTASEQNSRIVACGLGIVFCAMSYCFAGREEARREATGQDGDITVAVV